MKFIIKNHADSGVRASISGIVIKILFLSCFMCVLGTTVLAQAQQESEAEIRYHEEELPNISIIPEIIPGENSLNKTAAEPEPAASPTAFESPLSAVAADGGWALKNRLPGVDGVIRSSMATDNYLYVTGNFETAGGDTARSVSRFNFDLSRWESLELECTADCNITTLKLTDEHLYVAGEILIEQPQEGDEQIPPQRYSIARYNLENNSWEFLGTSSSGSDRFDAIEIYENYVYLGGRFSSIDEISAQNIARYDLTQQSWSALGSGITANVYALNILDADPQDPLLLIGSGLAGTIGQQEITGLGTFRLEADENTVANDEAWDIAGEIMLESFQDEGFDGYIRSIKVTDSQVFIAGFFDLLNNQRVFSLASYTPETQQWRGFSDGNFDILRGITLLDGQIYALTPNLITTDEEHATLLRINPSEDFPSWEQLGEKVFDDSALTITHRQNAIYVGGAFNTAGSQRPVGGIAGYAPDQDYWFTVGTLWADDEAIISGGDIFTSLFSEGRIIAAGSFSGAGSTAANRIAAFDVELQSWSGLGEGIGDAEVLALAASNELLFAGGSFTELGNGATANGLAFYDTAAQIWQAVEQGLTNEDGQPGVVHALLIYEDQLYIGGEFTFAGGQEAPNIARYDTNENTWHSLGNGTDGSVHSLHIVNERLFAGGTFSNADGIDNTAYLAEYKLESEAWAALEGGLIGAGEEAGVYALTALQDSRLFIGGRFSGTDAQSSGPYMAVYNLRYDAEDEADHAWLELPAVPDGPVSALYLYGEHIFVGGDFEHVAEARNANNIARYNWAEDSWFNLDEGVNAPVSTATAYADQLYLGGAFTSPASRFISWQGVSGFSDGDGSAARPFIVDSPESLARVGYFFDAHFEQSEDIIYPDQSNRGHSSRETTAFLLASAELPFRGVYEGNDRLIANWTHTSGEGAGKGLFAATEEAEIRRVHAHNLHLVSTAENVGGLIGHAHNTAISASSVTGHIRGSINTGGLVGRLSGSSVVQQTYYSQNIGSSYQNSIDGEILGQQSVGGLVGLAEDEAEIRQSFALGQLRILGDANTEDTGSGGLAGTTDGTITIADSYASVILEAAENGNVGGFVGFNRSPQVTVDRAYWNSSISALGDDLFAEGLTTSQMRRAESFEGYDFETIWELREGYSFPFLRSENSLGAVGPESRGTLVAAGPEISGGEGWRYYGLSFNRSKSLFEFTRGLTTQGFSGATLEGGISNVWLYEISNNDWRSITNIRSIPLETRSFAMFMFIPPLESELEAYPIVPMYRNPARERVEPIVGFELNTMTAPVPGGTWTLMANNNLWPIRFSAFELEGLQEVVYVYDPSIPGYISWNGEAGDLEGGIIQPFQGFFMETIAEEASFGLPASALVLDDDSGLKQQQERNASENLPRLRLQLTTSEGYESSAWISFSPQKRNKNARKLKPLDKRPFAELALENEQGQAFDIINIALNDSLPEQIRLPLSVHQYDENRQSVSTGFVLSWSELESFPDDWRIRLYDRHLDIYYDLKALSQMSFDPATAANLELLIEPQPVYGGEPTQNAELPDRFALEQNYPNPFNPTTTISFSLPEATGARLEVYNILGQRVASLVNQAMPAGYHNISFDARALSSGMYIYRLEAGQKVLTRKMMLLK